MIATPCPEFLKSQAGIAVDCLLFEITEETPPAGGKATAETRIEEVEIIIEQDVLGFIDDQFVKQKPSAGVIEELLKRADGQFMPVERIPFMGGNPVVP